MDMSGRRTIDSQLSISMAFDQDVFKLEMCWYVSAVQEKRVNAVKKEVFLLNLSNVTFT